VVGPAESSSSRSLHDIHPYFGWQTNPQHTGLRVQYRVGIHLGNLSNYQTGGENSLQKVKPELMVRLSYLNDIHLQADAGYGLLGVGNYTVRLGAGTGFGLKGGSNVTVGLAGAENKQGSKGGVMGFTSARIYLGKTGFMLEPYYAGNFDRMHQLSLRLHYRLALTKAQR
jgi:phosphatidylglycerol:prolipoprotein diacylglycerol transferase